jgi:pimeloyl-ACP methyl ester carboxylesterase
MLRIERSYSAASIDTGAAMNIKTNGIELNVDRCGSGDTTLLYLHYWGGSARTWRPVTAALPDDYAHVAVDLRGWGDSARPDAGYGLVDMAADVHGVIEALGLERYVLVGHSMGGKLAQYVAADRPAGLLGLVLVAPAPPQPLALDAARRDAMVHAYDDAASVHATLDHVLTAGPLPPALRSQVVADSLRGAAAAKQAWPHGAMAEDITARARRIDVPVTVVSGELDRVDPPATLLTHLLPFIPHAVLETVAGRGHLLPLEAPQAVAHAIRRFVDDLTRRLQSR